MSFDRQGVADHATQLANTIQGNLKRSLEALGVVSEQSRQSAASVGCTATAWLSAVVWWLPHVADQLLLQCTVQSLSAAHIRLQCSTC